MPYGFNDDKSKKALTASDVGAAPTSHNHSASDINSGTLASDRLPTVPLSKGGTGATTVAGARNALGLGNTNGAVPIANGGTGATSKAGAKANLGISYGTSAPSGGDNGDIYFQYS